MRNEISISFPGNDELANLCGPLNPGDKFCFVIHGQVNEISQDGMKGTIEKIGQDEKYDSSPADSDKGEVAPTHEEPVMVNIMGKMHSEPSATASQTTSGKSPKKPAASSAPYSHRR